MSFWATFPKRIRRDSSLISFESASARLSGVSSQRRPFSPSRMSVFTAGHSLHPIAGSPIDRASVSASPHPSNSEGNAKIDAFFNCNGTLSVAPQRRTQSSSPFFLITDLTVTVYFVSQWVSPQSSSFHVGNLSLTRAKASIKSVWRFSEEMRDVDDSVGATIRRYGKLRNTIRNDLDSC